LADDSGERPSELGLSAAEVRRYSRHLVIPEVGAEGQQRLKEASVLIVGAGGLGSPVSMYLAAAGVGRLGLVEFDRVEESNLQRQVLFGQSDIGRSKLEVAQQRLGDINPLIEIRAHPTRIEATNAMELVRDYDIVVDGSDNFPTRYLVNDACVLAGKPNVYGSIFRFEGQAAVFWGARGPCYRCLFPEPPPPGLVPSCAEGGVLGVMPGIIGSLQASEAVKLILGVGEPLIGRLIIFDALAFRFRELRLKKNPECPVCSERPTLTRLIDYEEFCGLRAEQTRAGDVNISPSDLERWQKEGRQPLLVDVRTPREWQICRLEGAQLMPLQELPGRWQELDPGQDVVVYCHHGNRSAHAVDFLRRMGIEKARNLAGGIEAWSTTVDPSVPRY
jgi:adenylyltransferase/sulfurtransferase